MSKRIIFCSLVCIVYSTSYCQTDTAFNVTDTVALKYDSSVLQLNPEIIFDDNETDQENNDEEIYKLKPAVDILVTAIAGGFSAFAFGKIYDKDGSTQAQINALRKDDINGFDRWAAGLNSKSAATTSDLFFYGSMPYPIVLLFDKHIRKDAAKIGFLYLEAMSITGLFYTGSTYLTDRYRPLVYNIGSRDEALRGGAKNSFIAGHPALVATSTFFTAKVFADYHPESKLKYLLYGVAIAGTGTTAYLRHRGGKHFPSDLLIGTAVGTLSGLLVPQLHKNKSFKNNGLSIFPLVGAANGVSVVYKF
jgi:membrane-associated phospholipid phosphatase